MIELPDLPLFAILVLLGGLLTLDTTTFGQFMVSRPIVAATLSGAIVGAPEYGMFVGVIMEALHLTVLPVGAARYPEAAAPAIAGGAAYALVGGGAGTLLVVIIAVLAWEWVCGETVLPARHLNSRRRPEPFDERFGARLVLRRHLFGLGIDFIRGVVLTAVGLVAILGSLAVLGQAMQPNEWTAWVAVGAASTTALAATIRMFGVRKLPFFLGGAGLGVLALLVL